MPNTTKCRACELVQPESTFCRRCKVPLPINPPRVVEKIVERIVDRIVETQTTVTIEREVLKVVYFPIPADRYEEKIDALPTMDEMEQCLIAAALSKFGGNAVIAAEALGISKTTIYRKLKEYEMGSVSEDAA